MDQMVRSLESFLQGHGINLGVPITKDSSRALVARNVRPDRLDGRIRSRLGHGAVVDTFPDSIHTIWLNQGSTRFIGAGTVLYRGNSSTSIVTGLDGRKLFLESVEKFVWIMNRNVQRKYDGTTVTDWWIAPPSTAATVATGAAGFITGASPVVYYVSFENAAGHESSVGPPSTPLVFTLQQANLSSIPTGPTGTTKRHIYRIGGGLEQLLRVATINNNTTTTYTDNEPNDVARIRQIQGQVNREAPPAARGVVNFAGRLVAWSTAEYPNRIYWSGALEYWYFPSENYQPIGDFNEEILACWENNGSLYVWKERSLWRVTGLGFSPERVTSEIGIPSETAIALGRVTIPFLSRKGLFRFDGSEPRKITPQLNPIFNGEGVPTGSGDALQAINLQQLGKAVLEVSDNKLYASIPGGVSTSNNQTVIVDLESGEIVHDSRGFTALHQEGVSGEFMAGIGTKLVSLDNGQTDEGTAIPFTYQSNFNVFGAPDNDKQVFEIRIRHTLNNQFLSLKVLFDSDTTTAATTITTALTGNGETFWQVNTGDPDAGRMCRSMSVLIEGTITSEVEIEEIQVSYFVHPRRTETWVSGVLNDGQTDMWEARQAQCEVDPGTQNVTVAVLTDGQGSGDVAQVESLTITVTGNPGRRSVPLQFSQIRAGRLWQGSMTSLATIRGYGMALEMRRVPVFLSGAAGQFYEQEPISLGA